MSPRVYVRKFDWDEARRLRAAGWSLAQLATRYGVSDSAIYRATNDEARAKIDAARTAHARGGKCPDCGTQTTRRAGGVSLRCRHCMAIAAATTARDGELSCHTCGEWKPDDAFPSDRRRIARRGRHPQCTPCQTKARADYRRRHAEEQRAYNRAYKARKKAAA